MKKRILVIDDDLYIREIYEEVLKKEGYEVESGQDGQEGLAKLQQGGYDLVLLDVRMPKLDGIAVLDALSQQPPQKPNGPIILLTNSITDPAMENVKEKGVTLTLVKADLIPPDLITHVKKTLETAVN